MIGIIITGHGSFPNGMLQSVELITGEISQLKVVPFEEDPDKLQSALENAIESVDTGSGVVCFADLAGGTPFNVSSRIAAENEQLRVIGGTNSPMLLSGVFQREQDIDKFVDAVLKEGKDNIKSFYLDQKQKKTNDDDDGI